jgi:sulfur-carrier protein adenylyltransferase/sulfurtransferase
METRNNRYERYSRQLLLKGFGEKGQQKLMAAKVLVVGAGGLGCPALQYLAGAGVGTIGIIDGDTVEISNLHRQPLYTVHDIGKPKAVKAAHVLKQLNPEVNFIVYDQRLTTQNALDVIGGFDIVIDGTDNFPSRYMINDACVLLQKPLVYGAVSQSEGQVAIFNCRSKDGGQAVHYRDLFPLPPAEGEVLNCDEAGVLGVLPGIIGTMQANETLKLITGLGEPLINRLFIYNALTNHTYELEINAGNQVHTIPTDADSFRATEYGEHCTIENEEEIEINPAQLSALMIKGNTTVIDIRDPGEEPGLEWFPHKRILVSQLQEFLNEADDKSTFVLVCQTGQRSLHAARVLTQHGYNRIYSLQGGVLQWQRPEKMKSEA